MTTIDILVISHPFVFIYNNRKICKILFDVKDDKNIKLTYNNCHPIPFEYKYFHFNNNNSIDKFKTDIQQYQIDKQPTDFYYGEVYNIISEYLMKDNVAFD